MCFKGLEYVLECVFPNLEKLILNLGVMQKARSINLGVQSSGPSGAVPVVLT